MLNGSIGGIYSRLLYIFVFFMNDILAYGCRVYVPKDISIASHTPYIFPQRKT